MEKPLTSEGAARNLDHIYFFVAKTNVDDSKRSMSPESNILSRSVSPSTSSSNGSGSGTGSSSSANSLNPLAADFTPHTTVCGTPAPPALRLYEIREIPGKGLGLFATEFIPQGTCLISESPLLRILENRLHLAWGSYCRLSNTQKKSFDALHIYKPDHLHLENASRTNLIDPTDESMDAEDIEELVQDQVRVMGTFACNNFQCGSGLAVFETTSRLNHSCVPNVHHSYNPSINRQTVHAVRPIQAGEELCTTYLGGQGAYQVRAQRIESLRTNYGFTCSCPACSDITGQSDGRRELMGSVAYGLQVYNYGGEPADPTFVPTSPQAALAQAEDFIQMLIGEGMLSIELCKAYRMASTLALGLKDWSKTQMYALAEAELETNCLGTDLRDLVKSGVAAACWVETVRKTLTKAGVFQVGQKLKKPVTEQQRAAKLLKNQKKKAKKNAEKDEQLQKDMDRSAARKARKEALLAEERKREEERRRMEYESAFPGLKA